MSASPFAANMDTATVGNKGLEAEQGKHFDPPMCLELHGKTTEQLFSECCFPGALHLPEHLQNSQPITYEW